MLWMHAKHKDDADLVKHYMMMKTERTRLKKQTGDMNRRKGDARFNKDTDIRVHLQPPSKLVSVACDKCPKTAVVRVAGNRWTDKQKDITIA